MQPHKQPVPRGITPVILILWALLCLRCDDAEPCDVYDALECQQCDDDTDGEHCLMHCVDDKWQTMIDCKAMIGDDAVCIEPAHKEAQCAVIGG